MGRERAVLKDEIGVLRQVIGELKVERIKYQASLSEGWSDKDRTIHLSQAEKARNFTPSLHPTP